MYPARFRLANEFPEDVFNQVRTICLRTHAGVSKQYFNAMQQDLKVLKGLDWSQPRLDCHFQVYFTLRTRLLRVLGLVLTYPALLSITCSVSLFTPSRSAVLRIGLVSLYSSSTPVEAVG